MTPEIQQAIANLQEVGWHCERESGAGDLLSSVFERYPWIPHEIVETILEVKELVNPDETLWILTWTDYAGLSDSSFAWNEWEVLSLESAQGDEEWISQIKEFWNRHFPIALTVNEGYGYYALREDGTIVHGREPEFEEVSCIADDFLKFLGMLAQ